MLSSIKHDIFTTNRLLSQYFKIIDYSQLSVYNLVLLNISGNISDMLINEKSLFFYIIIHVTINTNGILNTKTSITT
jgi:hypothetical protein